MAVEKMLMMNLVGNLPDVDNVLFDLLKTGEIDFVNALDQIENSTFIFDIDGSHLEKNIDSNYIEDFEKDFNQEEKTRKAKEIIDFFNIERNDKKLLEYHKSDLDIDKFYEDMKLDMEKYESIENEMKRIDSLSRNFDIFKNVETNLYDIEKLKYFDVRFGLLDKEGRIKLKRNYNNMVAIILHVDSYEDNEAYLAFYPKEVSVEIDRILKSLNWIDIDLEGEVSGTAKEALESLESKRANLEKELIEFNVKKEQLYKEKKHEIVEMVEKELLQEQIDSEKENLARSNKFFYLSGWVGASQREKLIEISKKYKDTLITFTSAEDMGEKNPPTKLKNFRFFKPFELLVKMYGIPRYSELDPTIFLGLTYMILFGAMFGDVGQGAVFVLAGLYVAKKINEDFGDLAVRLGISSMMFGVLYGSVFGNEEILKPIWLNPFENINDVLIIAIAFGVVLQSIAYIMGIYNAFKEKDLEEGLFGKEGLAGFILFLTFIMMVLTGIKRVNIFPMNVWIIIAVLCVAAMIFKVPLSAALEKKKPEYEGGDAAGYYIQGGFSMIETILAIVSGVISFIRVGAFAINHVGLFLAFKTMSDMMTSSGAKIIILIIGNILIIGLEGLIVFIQGLRLEYYELFSKYYKGDGYEFKPSKIKF